MIIKNTTFLVLTISISISLHNAAMEQKSVPPQSGCPICRKIDILQRATYDDNFADLISEKASFLYEEQLALAKTEKNVWQYVIVVREPSPQATYIFTHHCTEHKPLYLLRSQVRALKNYWQWTSQPYPPLESMQAVCQKFFARHVRSEENPFYLTGIIPSNSKIHVIGDLHGARRSLCENIRTLHCLQRTLDMDGILKDEDYVIFLGDYSDRGPDSAYVWHLLMSLKLLNPHKVFILRGNHEILHRTSDPFIQEWHTHFGRAEGSLALHQAMLTIIKLFSSLPQAILFGIPTTEDTSIIENYHFLLLCHGGIEPNILFNKALCKTIAAYKQSGRSEIYEFPIHLKNFLGSGLMWSDFKANGFTDEVAVSFPTPERGGIKDTRTYNATAAWEYMENHRSEHPDHPYTLDAIIRGHQHVSGGINRLLDTQIKGNSWETLQDGALYNNDRPNVYTCISSPEGLGPLCPQDSMLDIQFKPADAHQQGSWQLEPHTKIYKQQ